MHILGRGDYFRPRVYGVDASPETLARAGRKANKAGAGVVFKNGIAEALPFPDSEFDAVLSTVMLHLVLLVIAKHLGIFGALYTALRRRFRH